MERRVSERASKRERTKGNPYTHTVNRVGRESTEELGTDPSVLGHRKIKATVLKNK